MTLRIVMVAGEASGDILGAGLIAALKMHYPDVVFEGVGGERMQAEGFRSWVPLERLAVMGIVEPLKRLPELLRIRRDIKRNCLADPPLMFIGIDAPDFTIPLERALHKQGITTAHYVSPSVWAWRQGRVKTIAKAVDLMLTLFPFEAQFYRDHQVNVCFVGHPLADTIPMHTDTAAFRQQLGVPEAGRYLALLPGSRGNEVAQLGDMFFQVAARLFKENPNVRVLVAAANEHRLQELQRLQEAFSDLPVALVLGRSHEVIAASDVVLAASGTTTLEAMLYKKPMVIAYKLAPMSYRILKRLVKSPYIGLPNLLAGKALVPELIQDDATPESLHDALLPLLEEGADRSETLRQFNDLHEQLRGGASAKAANAIVEVIEKKQQTKS